MKDFSMLRTGGFESCMITSINGFSEAKNHTVGAMKLTPFSFFYKQKNLASSSAHVSERGSTRAAIQVYDKN